MLRVSLKNRKSCRWDGIGLQAGNVEGVYMAVYLRLKRDEAGSSKEPRPEGLQ